MQEEGNEAFHEDSDSQLGEARKIYHRILQGRHPEPDGGFETIRALLHEAGYAGQFHHLDDRLPEDDKMAEKHISTVVIPHSRFLFTLRKFQEYQNTEGTESEIKRISRRDELEALFEQSDRYNRHAKFPALGPILAELVEQHLDFLSMGDSLSSHAGHAADNFLRQLTQVQGKSWVEKVTQETSIIAEVNYRNTVSADIVLRPGAANTPKELKARRKRLKEITKENGIENTGVVANFNPDSLEQTITLTVDPSERGKLEPIIQAFEKESKGRSV